MAPHGQTGLGERILIKSMGLEWNMVGHPAVQARSLYLGGTHRSNRFEAVEIEPIEHKETIKSEAARTVSADRSAVCPIGSDPIRVRRWRRNGRTDSI